MEKFPSMTDDKVTTINDLKKEMKGGRLSEADMKRTAHKMMQKMMAE
jgi:hypothetical protein